MAPVRGHGLNSTKWKGFRTINYLALGVAGLKARSNIYTTSKRLVRVFIGVEAKK